MIKKISILLVTTMFIGLHTLYASDVKVKKIVYAQNIVYEGEAIQMGGTWTPKGLGTLRFSSSQVNPNFSHFKIDGQFDNTKVTSSVLTGTYSNEMARTFEGKAFEGELTFSITSEGKKSEGHISLSFEKGVLFGFIKEFTPFCIEYGPQKNNYEVRTQGMLSNEINVNIKKFDPYEIKTGVKFSSMADVVFYLGWGGHIGCPEVNIKKVIWEDGAVAEAKPLLMVTRGNTRWYAIEAEEDDYAVVVEGAAVLAIYNENERAIYPIHMTNYAKMGFENHFSRVLSDGTIIRGVHEDNTPHVKYVKCPDGQTFEGRGELGVIIKGGETMSSLFANKSLTKDDIELYNGTLYDANGEEIDSFGSGIGYYGEFPFFN